MGQHVHFFYAIELPGDVKEKLEAAAGSLKEAMPFNSWVHPEDFHITLAFLGNAPEPKMAASNQLIDEAVKKHAAFELTIDHLGIFGRKDSPRIFWAGLENSEDLNSIRNDVFSACLTSGFTLETRPFSPHITIARKWTSEQSFEYDQLANLNPSSNEKITFHAERVVLYKTHLGNSPKYEPIKIFSLASGTINEGEKA